MRDFGAIGYPPDLFYRAAITASLLPNKEHIASLKAAWENLSGEERAIFGLSRFPRLRRRESTEKICARISDAYSRRRSCEMTPPTIRRVRESLDRHDHFLRKKRHYRLR